MRTRAERRHLRQKAVAYAERKLREWKIAPDKAPYWADNMCKCSCDMCTAPHKRPSDRAAAIYPDEFDWGI